MPGNKRSCRLLVHLDSEDVAIFRFLLEAYDNLAIFSVLERRPALIKVIVSPESLGYLEEVLSHIGQMVRMYVKLWPLDAEKSSGFDNKIING